MIELVEYDQTYLEKSWSWLNDPEIKSLTNTKDFSKDEQKKWFNGLSQNKHYKIWGLSFNHSPIGVFGIKNINFITKKGEYWGYIGEKRFWGMGFGTIALNQILIKASKDLNLKTIYLEVLIGNRVAINLYKKHGFKEIIIENGMITMEKKL